MYCGWETNHGSKYEGTYTCPKHGTYYDIDKWAFRSKAWSLANFKHVNLKQIHRQSDEVFIKILQKLRTGAPLLPADTELLLDHPCKTNNAVRLFSTREEVRSVNREAFLRLQSKPKPLRCLDYFSHNPNHVHLAGKDKRAPPPNNSLIALQDHRYEPLIEL